MSPSPIRILCVDDHPVVRRGIAAMLATEPQLDLVAEAASGSEALEKYRESRPDVVLMDLRLPGGMDGIDTIVALRKEWPQARVARSPLLHPAAFCRLHNTERARRPRGC